MSSATPSTHAVSDAFSADLAAATTRFNGLHAAGLLKPQHTVAASTARVEELLGKFPNTEAIKAVLDNFEGVLRSIAQNTSSRRRSVVAATRQTVYFRAETIDDLGVFTARGSGGVEARSSAESGAGAGSTADGGTDISCLFDDARVFAEHYAACLAPVKINTFESLLKAGFAFMRWNNASSEVNGKYSYHDFPHGAEMFMDVLLKSAALVFKNEKFNFLSGDQKINLVNLLALCASYHDAYFRGNRMVDEAASAQLLIHLLGKCVGVKIPEDLAAFIELMILGGTLPVLRGSTMPALIETFEAPSEDDEARIVLFALARVLGNCDVHRTNDAQLRSATRVETFKERIASDENLSEALRSLSLIATEVYGGFSEEFRARYSFEDYFEAVLDKCGQNIRMGTETKITDSPAIKGLMAQGRALFGSEHLLELSQDGSQDAEISACFDALVSTGNANFMGVFARTVGGDFNLWHAHAALLNHLRDRNFSDDEKTKLGTLLALRAGAQDGAYLNVVLSLDAFIVSDLSRDLFSRSDLEKMTMDDLIKLQLSAGAVSTLPFQDPTTAAPFRRSAAEPAVLEEQEPIPEPVVEEAVAEPATAVTHPTSLCARIFSCFTGGRRPNAASASGEVVHPEGPDEGP